MEQITIFEYIDDPSVTLTKKRNRKNHHRMGMYRKIIEFQSVHFFNEQDEKFIKKLERAFKQEIFAYKEERAFGQIRVILQEGDFFTQGIYDKFQKQTNVFLTSHLQGRKSMWQMAHIQWTWRDTESIKSVIHYIEKHVLDDSKEKPWTGIYHNAIF